MMKLALIIWLVVALLFFLLSSTYTVYQEKSEKTPLFTGCFTLVYSLCWPIVIPLIIYETIKGEGKEGQ